MTIDVLSQLLEMKWRDVGFPVTEFTTSVAHDLAVHKWPDRDGAHVESTGRQPLTFRASIPFKNGVHPGPGETWGKQFLYPTVFRNFLTAFATRTSGFLQHPELGLIRCKPHTAEIKWGATSRDGCEVQASWIESLDDTVTEFQDILASKSPVADLILQADELDAQVATYPNTGLSVEVRSFSFVEAIKNITKSFNAITLASAKYGGYINHVSYRVSLLEDSVIRLRDNTAWPIIQSCERMKSSLHDLKKTALTTGRRIAFHTVDRSSTLAALTVITRGTVKDLLTLNPQLGRAPVISKGTIVRYYVAL